jgi:alpha-tubulin suppressor-like RCC1 family protein
MAAVNAASSRVSGARSWLGCFALAALSACGGGGAAPGNGGAGNGVTNPPVKTSGIGVSFSPGTTTMAAGTTDTVLVTIARTNFTGAVTLSVAGAPAGLTTGFAPPTVISTQSKLGMTAVAALAPGQYPLIISAAGSGITTVTAALVLTVTASTASPFIVAQVSASGIGTCALTPAGKAYCWGYDARYRIGDGSLVANDRLLPTAVAGNFTFTRISTSSETTCALTTTGAAYCWGGNSAGQIGDGTTIDRPLPTPVSGGLSFSDIAVTTDMVCGLSQGAIYCWCGIGFPGNGGNWANTRAPRQLPAGPTLVSFTAPQSSTTGRWLCGLTSAGDTYCWGGQGAFGDGDQVILTVNAFTPGANGLKLKTIATNAGQACGITPQNQAYCWGDGPVGDASEARRNFPVPVAGGHSFTAVALGPQDACALDTTGAAYCWGTNPLATSAPTKPVLVPAPLVGGLKFSALSIAANPCAIAVGGRLYCWGSNSFGQLGDGTTTSRTTPTAVVAP